MFTPCISAKHRQNETLNLWQITAGRSGKAVGDSNNVCQAFLPVGVWFPGPVDISREVRRIHSLCSQSSKALIS